MFNDLLDIIWIEEGNHAGCKKSLASKLLGMNNDIVRYLSKLYKKLNIYVSRDVGCGSKNMSKGILWGLLIKIPMRF